MHSRGFIYPRKRLKPLFLGDMFTPHVFIDYPSPIRADSLGIALYAHDRGQSRLLQPKAGGWVMT
jgi:hypothetical protein